MARKSKKKTKGDKVRSMTDREALNMLLDSLTDSDFDGN